jgi:hypothetical protein
MKLKFTNNTFIDYLYYMESEEHYNGSTRRIIQFNCDPSVISIDELNAILSNEENIKTFTMLYPNEEDIYEVCDGYVLKLKCGIESILVAPETSDHPAVYEDQLVFKLGKRTYIEEQLHKMGL